MKTLIIFTSKHGTTEKLAGRIAGAIPGSTDICNLKQDKAPELSSYDLIIIGTSIHMGSTDKTMRKYLENNKDILTKQTHALYLCHMDEGDGAREEFDSTYSEKLRESSIANGLFGGEYLMEKMNFIERTLIAKISGSKDTISNIHENELQLFIDKLNQRVHQ